MITLHAYRGLRHPEAVCEYIDEDAVTCGFPMSEHDHVSGAMLEPHSWHGRAAEGGSNTPCILEHCGELRLAKVHRGFGPTFANEPSQSQSETVYMGPLGRVTFAKEKLAEQVMAPTMPVRKPNPVEFADMVPAVQAWDAFAKEVRQLIVDKSRGYGDAWQEQGYLGNLARVLSKASRIKNMIWRDSPWLGTGGEESREEEESVLDNAYDAAALLAFLVANIEEGNRWGRG